MEIDDEKQDENYYLHGLDVRDFVGGIVCICAY